MRSMAGSVDGLVITPEELAVRLRLDTPLEQSTWDLLAEAIRDAQADVEGYLMLPVTPVETSKAGCYPYPEGWSLGDEYALDVVGAVAETSPAGVITGLFTVTYRRGLDVRHDPALRPIKRYIKAAAANDPDVVQLWTELTGVRGPVMNASTDGQSVTFAAPNRGGGGPAGSGAPGALPSLTTLDPWRARTAYQRPNADALGYRW